MRIKFYLLFVLLLLLLACANQSKLQIIDAIEDQKPNLIFNGSFETETEIVDSSYPGWIFDYDKVDQITTDSDRAKDGNYSLKFLYPKNDVLMVSDSFEVYHRNGYGIKLSGLSLNEDIPIEVKFITFNDSGEIVSKYVSNATVSKGKWSTFYFKAQYLKTSSKYARIFINIPKNNSVLFLDDVACYNIFKFLKK